MKHCLGSVGVHGSVRGPFFTRHSLKVTCQSPDIAIEATTYCPLGVTLLTICKNVGPTAQVPATFGSWLGSIYRTLA